MDYSPSEKDMDLATRFLSSFKPVLKTPVPLEPELYTDAEDGLMDVSDITSWAVLFKMGDPTYRYTTRRDGPQRQRESDADFARRMRYVVCVYNNFIYYSLFCVCQTMLTLY